MEEFETLGVFYALLNYLAPLVRFSAIFSFVFGSEEYQQLVGVVMAAISIGMVRPLLFKLSAQLASGTSDGPDSSRFHQLRLVWSQGLRVAAFVALYAIAVLVFDPRPYLGLDAPAAAQGGATYTTLELAGLGMALCIGWSIVWSLVQRAAPREKLTVAASTHDLSSASEDDLLRAMPPLLRTLSLLFRMLSVGCESLSDVLLLFVYLPSRLEGQAMPASVRPDPPLALLACALVYGSQHLRFRGEWLLCTLYGLLLGYTMHALAGHSLPVLVGAPSFAVLRHARRTGLDARQVHAE